MDEQTQEAQALERIADSIAYQSSGRDANGGFVSCLTEAVMGITGGAFEIANAIREASEAMREIAGAIRETKKH